LHILYLYQDILYRTANKTCVDHKAYCLTTAIERETTQLVANYFSDTRSFARHLICSGNQFTADVFWH